MNENPYQSPTTAGAGSAGLWLRESLVITCFALTVFLGLSTLWLLVLMLAQLRLGRSASGPATGAAYLAWQSAAVALMGRGLKGRRNALTIVGMAMIAFAWLLVAMR